MPGVCSAKKSGVAAPPKAAAAAEAAAEEEEENDGCTCWECGVFNKDPDAQLFCNG